ncbi:MAG: hypothetical protein ACLSE7_01845 [Lachnospirales bacterium]
MLFGKKLAFICSLLAAGMILLTAGCSGGSSNGASDASSLPVAKVSEREFLIRTAEGNYESTFLNGVNLGAAKAGYFPGEFTVTEEDYLRWFQAIHEMNVSVIRVYVSQMPVFYTALKQFSESAETPLWL